MSKENGTGADRLALIVDELAAELEQEATTVAQLQGLLDEAKARRVRIQRAIDTLTGTKATKVKVASTRTARKTGWTISEGKVAQVRALIATKVDPVTVRELATEGGMATESARRALEVLRDRDEVRMAGKRAGRGGGQKLYGPMPELIDAR